MILARPKCLSCLSVCQDQRETQEYPELAAFLEILVMLDLLVGEHIHHIDFVPVVETQRYYFKLIIIFLTFDPQGLQVTPVYLQPLSW